MRMRHRIVADIDTGIDDACALTWLVGSEAVELVACTTVAGNTTAELAARNTAAVLEICGASTAIPVVVGTTAPLEVPLATTPVTHGPTGLGHAELPDAAHRVVERPFLEVWREVLDAGPATLLATGPLTNLAIALREAPGLLDRFERIVIMGGTLDRPGNTTDRAEWNMWCDPQAAAAVFAHHAGRPVERLPILCPLDLTETLELHPAHIRGLAAALGLPEPRLRAGVREHYECALPVWTMLVNALDFYLGFHLEHEGRHLVYLHDLVAAIVSGRAVEYDAAGVAVDVAQGDPARYAAAAGEDPCLDPVDDRGALNRVQGPPCVRVVTHIDRGAVFEAWGRALRRLR